ncbi:MAG: hypothetical protein M1825_000702 [Sarcosagium campestre]|nr:MAG: hypothetical protein M1825_000702 [Sarcosagium campestre]
MEHQPLEETQRFGLGETVEQAPSAAPQHAQPPQQLPTQMFTTAAQLLDLTDKKLVVVLRDGRKLIGVLRSWDQFANLVLQDTVERIFVRDVYADIAKGIFMVRGENVLLLGEIKDLDKDDYIPEPYQQAPAEEVQALRKSDEEQKKKADGPRQRQLQRFGFDMENAGEILL